MATAGLSELMKELNHLAECFWAGEAEIATNFLTSVTDPKQHVQWLQHQCYRELRGPGLLKRHKSRTQWIIDNINDGLPAAESKDGRLELEYQLKQLWEEFAHFRLYADILEDVTGGPVHMDDLTDLKLSSDERIEALRVKLFAENPHLAQIAYDFCEGGGAGIFWAQAALETEDPLLLRIKAAGRAIYDDEVGHGEHGVSEAEVGVSTVEDARRLREMVIEIAQERLRMRAAMHGTTMSELRIAEITEGKIEPMHALV